MASLVADPPPELMQKNISVEKAATLMRARKVASEAVRLKEVLV